MTEEEMLGWHQRLDGHEFKQTVGDGDGQGGLASCSPRGRQESDTTERLNKQRRREGDRGRNPALGWDVHACVAREQVGLTDAALERNSSPGRGPNVLLENSPTSQSLVPDRPSAGLAGVSSFSWARG